MNDEKDNKDQKDPKFDPKKGQKHGRGRRGGRKEKGGDGKPPRNDFTWLSHYDDLLKVSARIATARYAGRGVDLVQGIVDSADKVEIPGVCAILTQLTMGTLLDVQSPGNLAIRNAWAALRAKVSGTIPVGVNEYFIYYASVGQVIAFLGWCDRLTSFVRRFNALNRYTPETLFTANGVNYNDFKNNIARFAVKVSYWKEAVQRALFIPKSDYLKNAYYIYSQVYTDSQSSEQAQYYIFVPYNFGKYEVTGSEAGPTLEFGGGTHTISPGGAAEEGSTHTVDEIIACGDELISALINDQGIMDVSGLLRRTYGEDTNAYFTMDTLIDLERIAAPIYDAEILLQIHNLVCAGTDVAVENLHPVIGVAGSVEHYIESRFTFTLDDQDVIDVNPMGNTIDPIVSDPSTEAIVMATRLKPTYEILEVADVREHTIALKEHDIVVPLLMLLYAKNPVSWADDRGSFANKFAHSRMTYSLAYLTQFDWAPYGLVYDSTIGKFQLFGDVYNIQPISEESLSQIHMAKLLSLFKIGA